MRQPTKDWSWHKGKPTTNSCVLCRARIDRNEKEVELCGDAVKTIDWVCPRCKSDAKLTISVPIADYRHPDDIS